MPLMLPHPPSTQDKWRRSGYWKALTQAELNHAFEVGQVTETCKWCGTHTQPMHDVCNDMTALPDIQLHVTCMPAEEL
jgi:hypothetical protein